VSPASNPTRISEAFLEYLETEETGGNLQAVLAAYPDIAPELEKKIKALHTFRQVYPVPVDAETPFEASMDLPLRDGESLGDFQVVRELGRGGMGVIYLARQVSIDRLVALKILSPRIAASESSRKRFLKEARAVGRLRDPNIVNVHMAGELRGLLFIAMEYVPGVGLDRLILELNRRNLDHPTAKSLYDRLEILLKSRGTSLKIPSDERANDNCLIMARLIGQMAIALSHAHRQGIVHRDIKPSNILIDNQGQGRLIDFGLNFEVGSQSLTQPSELFGSAYYLAPERLDGGQESELVDVYGLGVTLYEALTLRPAFKGETIAETLDLIKRNRPVLPRRINALIPRNLERIVMMAIDRNPKRRYQAASDLAHDLARFLDGLPVRARPVSRLRRLAAWIRRPVLYIALGICVTTALLFPWKRAGHYVEDQARIVTKRLVIKAAWGITHWLQWAIRSSSHSGPYYFKPTKTRKTFYGAKDRPY